MKKEKLVYVWKVLEVILKLVVPVYATSIKKLWTYLKYILGEMQSSNHIKVSFLWFSK